MNLLQIKLTKPECESIEKPIDPIQKKLVKMIIDGWDNIDIKIYNVKALIDLSKLSVNNENHIYLYNKYFKTMCNNYKVTNKKIKNPKKSDIIKSQDLQIKDCYEYNLIKIIKDIEKEKHVAYNYWTLFKLLEYDIPNLNIIIKEYSLNILKKYTYYSMIPLVVVSSLAGLGILFSISLLFLVSKIIYPWMAMPIVITLVILLLLRLVWQ